MKVLDTILSLVQPQQIFSTARTLAVPDQPTSPEAGSSGASGKEQPSGGEKAAGSVAQYGMVVSNMLGFAFGGGGGGGGGAGGAGASALGAGASALGAGSGGEGGAAGGGGAVGTAASLAQPIMNSGQMWAMLGEELGDDQPSRTGDMPSAVDRWTTKGVGEMLVSAKAYAPDGQPIEEVGTSARLFSNAGTPLIDRQLRGSEAGRPALLGDDVELRNFARDHANPWNVQMGRPEQRIASDATLRGGKTPRYFEGGERIVLENVHPTRATTELEVPRIRGRAFSLHKDGSFVERPMQYDTVRVFPHSNRGVAIWRHNVPVADENASDVEGVVTGYEDLDEPPKPASYYRDLLDKAKNEKPKPIKFFDNSLTPKPKNGCPDCKNYVGNAGKGGASSPCDGAPSGWKCGAVHPSDLRDRGYEFDPSNTPWDRFGCDDFERLVAKPGVIDNSMTPKPVPKPKPGVIDNSMTPGQQTPKPKPGVIDNSMEPRAPDANVVDNGVATTQPLKPDPGNLPITKEGYAKISPPLDLPPEREETEWRQQKNQRPHRPTKQYKVEAPERGEKDELDFHLESTDFETEGLEAFRFENEERLGKPFRLTIDFVRKGGFFDPMAAIGASAALVQSWSLSGGEVRRLNGIITKIEEELDSQAETAKFRLHIGPKFEKLALSSTQEIFLDMSIVDVITEKLQRAGLQPGADFEMRLAESYPPRDFITQYKETDLAFVSRLCEHDGITMWFDNMNGDRVIFTDSTEMFDEHAPIALRRRGDRREIFHLTRDITMSTSTFEAHDYNYRTPRLPLRETHEIGDAHGGVVVEYGGHGKTPEETKRYARIRGEAEDSRRVVYRGDSDCCWIYAGARFDLEGDHGVDTAASPSPVARSTGASLSGARTLELQRSPSSAMARSHGAASPESGATRATKDLQYTSSPAARPAGAVSSGSGGGGGSGSGSGSGTPHLLVTSIKHTGNRPIVLHGGAEGERNYTNSFIATRGEIPYRPALQTKKPRIGGIVNAIVEHDIQKGTEYWAKIDAWGRYSVRFLFDAAAHPSHQSRWCRMIQPHAGPNYGTHFPLRPGIEVMIAFVDADPDRPIIVGSIPNPVTPSPVTRSNHRMHQIKTVSGCHIEIYDAPERGGK